LALAARYVLASSSPKTRFGLPEVQLGLLPGLGGTVRLPERVGLERALDMMLTGRNLFAKPARKAGLVQAVHHPEGLVEAAIQAARRLASGELKVPRPKRALRATLLERTPLRSLIFSGAAKQVAKSTHGNYPAPGAILEVVDTWAKRGREAGLNLSAKRFAELLFTPQARALIHLFFSQTAAKKNPWQAAAREVKAVGVLGAGLMGSGIAEVSAANGMNVYLKDRDLELALKGKHAVYKGVSGRVGKGRTPFERDQIVERVHAVESYAPLAGADVTIEAVLELPDLKRQMVAEVEAVTGEQHLFASNTSAIPISEIASAAKRPEAVVGMHYFSPVPKMPLLEIVATDASADWALGTAYALGLRQGKTVIVVGDGRGFYTTRALAVYVGETLKALREGADPLGLERAVVDYGFPLGPLAMTDDVGIDVGAKIQDVLAATLRQRGLEPDPASADLAAAGYLGRKSGKGFYKYEGGKRKQEIDPEAVRLAGFPISPSPAVEQGTELAERLAFAVVREAILCLEEGVLRGPQDGDLGAVFGFGFPPFRGGPFFLVDQLGAAAFLARLQQLEARHGARFAPPASLVALAESGGSFYDRSAVGADPGA
ncbi:MAG: 3-hydroxyacyl-CoA dehydrogenase NAD-binding domain-containing protein, partial [Trueperaceae bacterium]